jgi:hypothetical protein
MDNKELIKIEEYLESIGQGDRLAYILLCSEFNKAIHIFITEFKKVNPALDNEVISAVLMTTFIEHCKILKMNKEQIRNKFVTGLKLYFEDEENG